MGQPITYCLPVAWLCLSLLAAVAVAAPFTGSVKMTRLEPAEKKEQPPITSGQDGREFASLQLYAKFGYEWEAFKAAFKRVYADSAEDLRRLRVFAVNLLAIDSHNRAADLGLRSFRMGVNQFADMDSAEFRRTVNCFGRIGARGRDHLQQQGRGGAGSIAYLSPAAASDPAALPASVDWRARGAVTPVKDQGHCGSCWSFSATGALEGQQQRKTGRLTSLSEQQLIDCSASFGNAGCNGGLMDAAFRYAHQFGLETESVYPYLGQPGAACGFNASRVVAGCTGFVYLPAGDEAKLLEAVANVGPMSVAIDASQRSFQLYKGGIYDEPSCSANNLDHGVLLVGYGVDATTGAAYWLVKNSWNVHWGEAGYVRIARNKANMCGIASSASYPTV